MEHLKRLVSLWELLANHTQLSEFVDVEDIKVFNKRVRGEGLSFLTVTLPRLFKSLDSAMQTSKLVCPVGFKSKKDTTYPMFLQRAWAAIFNEDGSLRPTTEVHTGAVACIRQLSAVFYKLETPHTEDQESDVIDAFLHAENDLSRLDLTSAPMEGLLKRARRIVCRLLCRSNPHNIRPQHGSGSSSCRVKPWERYETFRFIPRLDEEFPYAEYFYYSKTHLVDELDKLLEAEVDDPPARVVFVPKDSRGPRLISCEPREFMYIQQGLMAELYRTVRSQPAINSQIGFTDQTRNQELASIGSKTGAYATLDLKEASDRVSLELVRTIFPDNWFRALNASRSKGTELPSGDILSLAKFAPMGSACCFPVEAICFWAIALAAIDDQGFINRTLNSRLTERDMRISVFGDDIIVPTEHAQKVMTALESCGLLVNKDKSYWKGPFRESCGGDFFNEVDVAPIRVKTLPDRDMRSRHRTAQMFNNIIGKYGYQDVGLAAQLLFESWYGPVVVSNDYRIKPGLCERLHQGLTLYAPYTDIPDSTRRRFHVSDNPLKPSYQRMEYALSCETSIDIEVNADRWSQILRRDLKRLLPENPTERHALARRVRYKTSWVTL